MEIPSEENALMPDSERFYLYRVEMYLIHKYAPQLVDEMRVTSGMQESEGRGTSRETIR